MFYVMLHFERKVNAADNAWLDISASGLWNSYKKTFDIRITHPTSVLFWEVPSTDLPTT